MPVHLVQDVGGDPQFAQLSGHGLGGAGGGLLRCACRQDARVLDILLCQGRAALHLVARQRADQRARSAAQVERAVLIEPRVLDRNRGVAHRRRDLVIGNRNPVDVARVEVGDQMAVRVHQFGPLGQLPQTGHRQVVEDLGGVAVGDPRYSDDRQRGGCGKHARTQRDDGEQANGLAYSGHGIRVYCPPY